MNGSPTPLTRSNPSLAVIAYCATSIGLSALTVYVLFPATVYSTKPPALVIVVGVPSNVIDVLGSDDSTRTINFVAYAIGGTTNVVPHVRVGGICSIK